MVDGVGVVGSCKPWDKREDYFGEKNCLTLMSRMEETKAMFISVQGLAEIVDLEKRKEEVKSNRWHFPVYFLMPDNVLITTHLSRAGIDDAVESLGKQGLRVNKYICTGKPYIPTGELDSKIITENNSDFKSHLPSARTMFVS